MAIASRITMFAAAMGLGLAAVPAHAQTEPAPPIWVIEGEESAVYLIGTVHLMRTEVDWQSTEIDDILAGADVLWLELPDLDPPDDLDALIMQYGISPDQPLSALLTEEERADLEAILDQHDVPYDAFEHLRPWFAYIQLTGLAMIEAGLDPEAGIDVQLLSQAQALDIPVMGFETFESQLFVLSDMSEEAQVDILRMTIAEYEDAMDELVEQLESWIDGDLSLIEAGTMEIAEEMPEFYDVLFAQRNHMFADGIEEIVAGQGTALVAVGLGHFVGPDSIPDILEDRGYTLERR